MRRALMISGCMVGVAIIVVAAYLLLPYGVVESWHPSALLATPAGHMHAHALEHVQWLGVGVAPNPVALAVEPAGSIYSGSVVIACADGRVMRMSADGTHYQVLGNTHGRPFGVAVTVNSAVLVADGDRGLLALDGHGRVLRLGDAVNGAGVGVASTGGSVYFTRRSRNFSWQQMHVARFAHDSSGSLLVYDVARRRLHTVADHLSLPRGVALGPKGAYALVAESGSYRIVRVWLKGPKAGQTELFASGLPGFPAGISFNGTDRFWVAIPAQRIPQLDVLAQRPVYRRLLLRLPAAFLPRFKAAHGGMVIGFDLDGERVAELRGEGKAAYAPVTVAAESGPWLWLGSDAEDAVARIPLQRVLAHVPAAPVGWKHVPSTPVVVKTSPPP